MTTGLAGESADQSLVTLHWRQLRPGCAPPFFAMLKFYLGPKFCPGTVGLVRVTPKRNFI
jgi:hypothetical protein